MERGTGTHRYVLPASCALLRPVKDIFYYRHYSDIFSMQHTIPVPPPAGALLRVTDKP
jgi:hypothetical protein